MKKNSLWIVFLLLLIASGLIIQNTYALFENNSTGDANMDIGQWIIHINENDISNGLVEKLNLNSFVYTENENVADGYIAPGRNGYANIIIDPTGTDVAIRYDLTFNTEEGTYADNISLSVQQENGSTIKTGPNTYSGIIGLDEIGRKTITLRVDVSWNEDGNHDETDTLLGGKEGESISIPVDVNISQYLGEGIEEYISDFENTEDSNQ